MKLKKGDNVIVTAGKNKGQKGTVQRVFKDTNRIIVDGVNKAKRHIKARSKTEKGSIVEVEVAFNASNVMFIDSKTGTGTRLGRKEENGKMVRFEKKSGKTIK